MANIFKIKRSDTTAKPADGTICDLWYDITLTVRQLFVYDGTVWVGV